LQSKTITLTTNVVTVTSTVHRAMGGPVFPGFPTMVGEQGPEMYVPNTAGYIIPAPQARQMTQAAPAPQVQQAGPGMGAAPTLVIQMSGREVARAVMPEMYKWMIRNSGSVTGVLKPS
jgi:hypothetical protein